MRFASLFLVTALTALVVSCTDDTSVANPAGPEALTPAAAEVFHDNFFVPVDEVLFVPCANGGVGEDVRGRGTTSWFIRLST